VTAVSPQGLHQVRRYLLPSERPVITTRRHWVVVVEPILSTALGVTVSTWAADAVGDSVPLLVNVVLLATVALLLRLLWKVWEYRRDWFVVTDERLLLTYGLLTRRVAIMPLTKVTDMSYNVSLAGRVLGYGEFVFESAGQDQALHTVNYLGRSQELFAVLSTELFGEHGIASSRRRRRPRSTED
jgi:membrane protein YdbS with pleckstrin-like domain